MARRRVSRRGLLKLGAAAACFSIVPRHVLGGRGYTAPSDQLTNAVIGVGGIGMAHVGMPGAKLLAVCDVDRGHLNHALEVCRSGGNKEIKGYGDFREVLARPDVDIVHVATPPHWHALIAQAAAEAGKDIWCEKPFTRTIREGEKLVETVQRYGRILRINTWWRLGMEAWPESRVYSSSKPVYKIVRNGLLGWPVKFTLGASTGFDWKFYFGTGNPNLPPQPVPSELDYDMWLGPAPAKAYHVDRVHFKFRGYWDYDGGGLGDMGQHYMDPVQYLLGKDEESPVEIEADGPEQHPEACGPWRAVRIRYADGCEILLDGTQEKRDDVPFIEGPDGKVFNGLRSTIPDLERKLASLPEPPPLNSDFHACVRERKPFGLNERTSHRSCTLVNLAKIAVRVRRVLHFDHLTQRFIGDDGANRLIEEPMRAPWQMT